LLLVSENAVDQSNLDLTWGASCSAGASDYSIHEGVLGEWYSHGSLSCSTGGATAATITPSPFGRYYLVVPINPLREGSYGTDSQAVQRPASMNRCRSSIDASACQ
jgi:hypothetical protein